jgi:hypothetical protein
MSLHDCCLADSDVPWNQCNSRHAVLYPITSGSVSSLLGGITTLLGLFLLEILFKPPFRPSLQHSASRDARCNCTVTWYKTDVSAYFSSLVLLVLPGLVAFGSVLLKPDPFSSPWARGCKTEAPENNLAMEPDGHNPRWHTYYPDRGHPQVMAN